MCPKNSKPSGPPQSKGRKPNPPTGPLIYLAVMMILAGRRAAVVNEWRRRQYNAGLRTMMSYIAAIYRGIHAHLTTQDPGFAAATASDSHLIPVDPARSPPKMHEVGMCARWIVEEGIPRGLLPPMYQGPIQEGNVTSGPEQGPGPTMQERSIHTPSSLLPVVQIHPPTRTSTSYPMPTDQARSAPTLGAPTTYYEDTFGEADYRPQNYEHGTPIYASWTGASGSLAQGYDHRSSPCVTQPRVGNIRHNAHPEFNALRIDTTLLQTSSATSHEDGDVFPMSPFDDSARQSAVDSYSYDEVSNLPDFYSVAGEPDVARTNWRLQPSISPSSHIRTHSAPEPSFCHPHGQQLFSESVDAPCTNRLSLWPHMMAQLTQQTPDTSFGSYSSSYFPSSMVSPIIPSSSEMAGFFNPDDLQLDSSQGPLFERPQSTQPETPFASSSSPNATSYPMSIPGPSSLPVPNPRFSYTISTHGNQAGPSAFQAPMPNASYSMADLDDLFGDTHTFNLQENGAMFSIAGVNNANQMSILEDMPMEYDPGYPVEEWMNETFGQFEAQFPGSWPI